MALLPETSRNPAALDTQVAKKFCRMCALGACDPSGHRRRKKYDGRGFKS